MALKNWKKKTAARKERGMTLIELMIAMVVLLVGVVGSMALVAVSIGGNGRNRQQSNSTTISQLVTEKISSVSASTVTTLTITDCAGNSATFTTAAGGSALLGSGDVDFTQAALANYSLQYTDCATGGRQTTYDVRWNIQTISPYVKLLTVSAQKNQAGTDLKYFSRPVTIRTLIGQGS